MPPARAAAAVEAGADKVSLNTAALRNPELITTLAKRYGSQAVIVAIDELQWAEPTFLDLLEYLVGWTTDAPVLVLGLTRPELLEHRPTWNSTSSLVLALEPLSDADSERLVDALGGHVDEDDRIRILAGAEGNPLFVEQMRYGTQLSLDKPL